MASAVNKLASEARCLTDPSRRLDSDILWQPAHRWWAVRYAVLRAKDVGRGSMILGAKNHPVN
jgi:hypothetical protein